MIRPVWALRYWCRVLNVSSQIPLNPSQCFDSLRPCLVEIIAHSSSAACSMPLAEAHRFANYNPHGGESCDCRLRNLPGHSAVQILQTSTVIGLSTTFHWMRSSGTASALDDGSYPHIAVWSIVQTMTQSCVDDGSDSIAKWMMHFSHRQVDDRIEGQPFWSWCLSSPSSHGVS